MRIAITPDGLIQFIYTEAVDTPRLARALGAMTVRRASHVEPTEDGRWTADMSPMSGELLGPFDKRSEALTAETEWLDEHLGSTP